MNRFLRFFLSFLFIVYATQVAASDDLKDLNTPTKIGTFKKMAALPLERASSTAKTDFKSVTVDVLAPMAERHLISISFLIEIHHSAAASQWTDQGVTLHSGLSPPRQLSV